NFFTSFNPDKPVTISATGVPPQRYTITPLKPGDPESREIGVALVAVPSVGADGKTISLMLNPLISQFERFTAYGAVDLADGQDNSPAVNRLPVRLPVFSKREVKTKVIVQSGETVVLGGLIDTVDQEVNNDLPFLSDIPVAGKLFQRNDSTETRLNLLIFVTATVISDRGESLVPIELMTE
ncbi:MAG: hypothetical protein AAF492_28790, partial [Verrucomicrobiota bacterium]